MTRVAIRNLQRGGRTSSDADTKNSRRRLASEYANLRYRVWHEPHRKGKIPTQVSGLRSSHP